jgi:hypothetical protein
MSEESASDLAEDVIVEGVTAEGEEDQVPPAPVGGRQTRAGCSGHQPPEGEAG